MITSDDIAEGVTALWSGNGTLTGLVTRLWLGRADNSAVSPYATLKITGGDTIRPALGPYVQPWQIEVTVWDEAGAADVGGIEKQIELTLGPPDPVLGGGVTPGRTLSLTNGRTLRIMAANTKPGGTIEDDPATQKNQAVKVAKRNYEWLCQG